MKKTFKFASLMLALVLAFCFSTVAFAETAAPAATDAPAATVAPVAETTEEAVAETTEEAVAGASAEAEVTAPVNAAEPTAVTDSGELSNPVSVPEGVRTAIIIVIVLCAAILITVVLMQQTKSGGLGGAFGGDTQSFTARGKAASRETKLQKITLAAAVVIAVLAILLAIFD